MERRALKASDRWLFRLPGDPQVSPDGSRVAFVVQRADRDADRVLTDIYIADVSGGEPRQLTNSGKDRSPRWSPDGKIIAFVSDREGKPQIWMIDITGGEAWCLHTEIAVMSTPLWSPDGKMIAFTSRVFSHDSQWVPYKGAPEGDEQRARAQAASEPKPDKKDDKTPDVKVITRFKHKFDVVGYLGDKRNHVFIVDVPHTRPASPLKPRQLTAGDFDHDAPSWSPDSKHLVFVATRRPDADWLEKSDIWSVDVETGAMSQLLNASGMSNWPRVSPDGKMVAYVGHGGEWRTSTSTEIRVFPFDTSRTLTESDVTSLTRPFDRSVTGIPFSDTRYFSYEMAPAWSADGSLYFILGHEGDSDVYRWAPGSDPDKAFGEPDHSICSFSIRGDTLAIQMGSHTMPDEIYVSRDGSNSKLTSLNYSVLSSLAICHPERIKFTGPDGWQIDGWVMKPSGYEEAKSYPAVLMIHGGPHGVYGSAFSFQEHLLASNGIAVIYTNPRGSQAYGQVFANACVGDWGGKDYGDLMAGVDKAVSMGIADPDRLGVTGWSYGGYMTCWVVTQTSRFKAAMAGACISNRHSLYGTGDIPLVAEHHCASIPWAGAEIMLERSAVSYLDKVETPVLIIHGEADLRCPVGQADEFFSGLRRLGKEAVYVRYPGEFHIFRKPSHIEDRDRRVLAWFSHYLKG